MTIQLKTNRQIATYCWLDIEFRTYRRFLDETNKIPFEIQLCLALKNFLLSLFFQVLNSSLSELYCHAKIMVRWRLCQNKSISTNFPRFSYVETILYPNFLDGFRALWICLHFETTMVLVWHFWSVFLEKSIEEMRTTMYYYSLFALGFSIDVLARRGNQTQKHRWFFPYAKTYTNFQGDCKLFFYVVVE